MAEWTYPWCRHLAHCAPFCAVEGVTVYISDFKRSLADKLSKNFFSEPSQVIPELRCMAKEGPILAIPQVQYRIPLRHALTACSVQASVTCAATGPVRIKDVKRISGPEGSEVFSEQKGLNFFQNKVCRLQDVVMQRE